MAQYTNLNASPEKSLRDIVAGMKAEARQSKTGAHGVKDLGESGDVVWPRPDGTPVSVRDVDLELADARQRIEDAETSLAENGSRLTDAEQAVQDAVAEIGGKVDDADLDDPATSERLAGSMTDVTRSLIVTDSAILNHATLIGQTVVDDINVQGKLIGTDGVFTGTVDFENVNVSDQVLAERLAGEYIYGTVVEGGEIRTTDGLPGQVILSDEGYVDSANGGRSPGITIIPIDSSELVSPPGMGPNENGFVITGGRNKTGGRGYSIYAPQSATMRYLEGNASANMQVSSGYAWSFANDGNGNQGEIFARPTFGLVKATAADGSGSLIQATPKSAMVMTQEPSGKLMSRIMSNGREAYLWSTGSDGLGRVLSVDSDGVWVKVQRGDGSGLWDHVSLVPQVRQFQYSSQWNADQSPAHIMVQNLPGGKLCQAQIRIQNLTGSPLELPYDTWVLLNYNPIPSDLRGGFSDYIEVTLPQLNARGRVEMNYSTGRIRIKALERDSNGNGVTISWTNNSSIWFPMRWFSPN